MMGVSPQVISSTKLPQLYREKGYVALRGLFGNDEVLAWQAECDRLLAQDWISPRNIRTPFRMNATELPERIDPVVDVSPVFEKLVSDKRILSTLRGIFDDEALLFKDKLILKAPGVDGYTMHQDWAWGWQELCPADDILSVSIQIDGADESNGCIELFPDYHRELLTPAGIQTNFRDEELAKIDLSHGEKMETAPGDVLIFHSLTPHQSGKNTAEYSRRSLYLTYNAKRAGDLKTAYYENYRERAGGEGSFLP
jgi:hypothetical protein